MPRPKRQGAWIAAGTLLLAASARLPEAAADPPAAQPAAESPLDRAPLDRAIDRLQAEVRRRGGMAGVAVLDVGSGKLLAAAGEHLLLNPASNAKLATSAVALRRLGPGFRYATGLYGVVHDDTVERLVLRGGGDPSLETRDLWAMVRELSAAGVRRVATLFVDQSAFDASFVPPAFEQQPNEWATFRAPVAALSLDGNAVMLVVRPAAAVGSDAVVTAVPRGFVDVSGRVTTTAKTQAEKIAVALEPRGGRLSARVEGQVPRGGKPLRIPRRVDDPRLFAGYVLASLLEEAGVKVASGPALGGGARDKSALVVHRSRPLAQLLQALGKDSDNFYAEMVFKSLAAGKAGQPATAEAAARIVEAHEREVGAWEEGSVVRNGSGLFDANRTSAAALVSLLRAAFRDPAIGPDFVAQLSIAGADGTLRGRLARWGSRRAIRAKSGTLRAVTALSGYVLGPSGRSPLAFAVIANGIPDKVGEVRPFVDDVVDAAAQALWR